jgi:chloride channel protein, CIC family
MGGPAFWPGVPPGVFTATLVARTIEPRSIYEARLTDEEVAARQKSREAASP